LPPQATAAGLRGVDEAIRARFNLVPFTVTIPKEKRDKTLPERLRQEWPGILQWAIAGCLAWQSEGLNPPKIVRDATEDYLGEEDAIARWIEDCCAIGPNQWCASGDLWNSWKPWSEANNERVGTQKSLGSALEGHGYLRRRNEKGARGFQGLRLKPGIDLN
jgi:putative DNA primase/helicase